MTAYRLLGFFGIYASAVSAADVNIERIMVTAPRFQQQWLQSAGAGWSQAAPTLPSAQFTDLFRGLPGLQADPRTTLAQDPRLTIRGFGGRSAFGTRGLEFLLDGVPQSTTDGQLQLAGLMTDDLAQLEILRGPMAALYGNAAGGVIAAQARAFDETAPTELNASWQLGAGFAQQRLRLSSNDWTAAVQQSHYAGFRPQQQAKRQAANVRLQQSFDEDIVMSLRLDGQRDPLLQDPLALTLAEWHDNPNQASANAGLFDTRKSTEQLSGSLGISLPNTELRVWQVHRAIEQFQAQSGQAITSSGGVVALSRQARGILIEQQVAWSDYFDTQALHSEISLQHEHSDEHRLGFVNLQGRKGDLRRDEQANVDASEVAVRNQWQFAAAWQLFGGWRSNHYRYQVADHFIQGTNPDDSGARQFQGHNFAGGVLWHIDQAQSLQWSYGQGFELPTLADLAYRADGAGLNNHLVPAENQQWELVYRQQREHWKTELSAYDIRSTNELAVFSSVAGRTVYYNAAHSRRFGIEAALSYQQDAYDAKLALLWSRNRFLQGEATALLPGISQRQAQLQFGWQLTPAWRISTSANAQSRMAMDDKNSQFAPGRITMDVHASYQIHPSWTLFGQVSNLFDQPYVAAVIVNAQGLRGVEPGTERLLYAGIIGRIQLE